MRLFSKPTRRLLARLEEGLRLAAESGRSPRALASHFLRGLNAIPRIRKEHGATRKQNDQTVAASEPGQVPDVWPEADHQRIQLVRRHVPLHRLAPGHEFANGHESKS